jgi:predicted dehydrogenase
MPAMGVTRYGIVGGGWRSDFFLRLARSMPERFGVTGIVSPRHERRSELREQWSVPTFAGIAELVAHERPEFVIVAVPWDATPDAIREVVAMGLPVLAETPPAPDADRLRALWHDVGPSGLVQVAEQYALMPGHAARLALVREAVIGEATSVQVSSTHLYHAVSLIRLFLGATFEAAEVHARQFRAPLADPVSRDGWSGDGTPKEASTTIATIDFGNGRMGLYDFTDNQWHNPLRTRRIVVRGSNGELVDDRVVRLVDPLTPVTSELVRRQTGFDLDHISFDGRVVYRNPYAGIRLSDEEIAISTMLDGMGAWTRGEGPPPYPLADGCQDHVIGLAIDESVASGKTVRVPVETWAR